MGSTYLPQIADLLRQAADIPAPWRGTKFSVDEGGRIIHLWITRHPVPAEEHTRNWFRKGVAPVPDLTAAADACWRHLNCMGHICMLHTSDQLDAQHHGLPWFGVPGQPFSNAMLRQMFMCLAEGMELGAICNLLHIQLTDLWKFKFGLDNGQINFDYTPVRKARPANVGTAGTMRATAAFANQSEDIAGYAPGDTVPAVTDPVWEQLISGDLNIQIKTLSFQMILTKLRQQFDLQQSNDVRIMKLRELHRYVERNERCLNHELAQLVAQRRVSATQATGLTERRMS